MVNHLYQYLTSFLIKDHFFSYQLIREIFMIFVFKIFLLKQLNN